MILYDSPGSSNALKVRFLLAELGIDHERVEIPLSQPRPPELARVNPLNVVPVIDDDGFVLSESNTILRYLAVREVRTDLYPDDVRERATVDEFLDRYATRLRGTLFRHEVVALGRTAEGGWDSAPRDPVAAAKVAEEIAPGVALLDSLVGPDAVVLGRFTIADCAIAPVLFRTTITGLDLAPYPNLRALRDTLLARPAWALAGAVT